MVEKKLPMSNQNKDTLPHLRNILCLNVSSVEDLKAQLKKHTRKRQHKGFVALAVTSEDILVCPIHFKNISPEEIDDKIKFLVFNLLNSSIDQVVLSYQVFSVKEDQCTGVIACAKKNVIDQYLHVCDDHHFIPYRLIPYSLVSIDSFCHDQKINLGRCCVIHCSEDRMIHLCILQDGKCSFIREIVYEDLQRALRDIEQTLSSSTALSKYKFFDKIYFFGDGVKSNELAQTLKLRFNKNFFVGTMDNKLASLATNKKVFQINLFQGYTMSFHHRSMLEFSMIVILLIMTFTVTLFALQNIQMDTHIIGIRSTYAPSDVQRAYDLIERLNTL